MRLTFAEIRKRMQMASGSILALYVLTHFLNHTLGLWGLDAMEAGRAWFNLLWRSILGTAALYGALACHFILALVSVYERRTMKMPALEWIKIVSGFMLPFLLAQHVIGTRLDLALFGEDRGYPQILAVLATSPNLSFMQTTAMLIGWTHGCLGIWFWLRAKPWFETIAPAFHMTAVAIPLMALFGYFAGLDAMRAAGAPGFPPTDPGHAATLDAVRAWIGIGVPALIAMVLIFRLFPRRGQIEIRYAGGQIVSVSPGVSVLEASRLAGIPHVSICGGRGRCSTCRIEVLHGLESQPQPDEGERSTLAKIGAPANVRLACQFKPRSNVAVSPLVEAGAISHSRSLGGEAALGRERKIVALFCDLRSFTQVTEKKLPYDVVFLLNRYFALVGEAVESSGGVIDKFIGDGAVALFGLETSFPDACRQALLASIKLSQGLNGLNQAMGMELSQPLRLAIGVNGGTAIVGKIGYGRATTLTAVGDMMNTTSRLEGLAKQYDVELAVAANVVDGAGVILPGGARKALAIRGREATIEACLLPKVADVGASVHAMLMETSRKP